jgi:hypothetical protein
MENMSTQNYQTVGFGARLKEERERLAIKQDGLGVSAKTQWLYEKSERSPDLPYLAAFGARGADILYIVTGLRSDAALTADQQHLLAAYHAAAPSLRAAALAVLVSGDAQGRATRSISVGGDVGQVVQGDAKFDEPIGAFVVKKPGKGKK